MTRPRPEDYRTRQEYVAALIAYGDWLAQQAQALPEIPDPPSYPWE